VAGFLSTRLKRTRGEAPGSRSYGEVGENFKGKNSREPPPNLGVIPIVRQVLPGGVKLRSWRLPWFRSALCGPKTEVVPNSMGERAPKGVKLLGRRTL
jgi:hypothetical protein